MVIGLVIQVEHFGDSACYASYSGSLNWYAVNNSEKGLRPIISLPKHIFEDVIE